MRQLKKNIGKINTNPDILMKRVYDGCTDQKFRSVEEFWATQLNMHSATLDGENTRLEGVDPTQMLMKAALTTGDTGAVNSIYSLLTNILYATRRNAYGILGKVPWKTQGFRVATTAAYSSAIGVTEGAAIGTAAERTYVEVAPTVKEWEVVSDFSKRLEVMSDIADAVTIDQDRQGAEADFFRSLNTDMLTDCDTLAGANIESLDRVCASYSEMAGSGYTTGDMDIYSQDRDAATTSFDAYVDHGSTTDRDLSVSIIDNLFANTYDYWDDQSVDGKAYLTGLDTLTRWGQLEAAKQRFEQVPAQITIGDGIRTFPGIETGFMISTYNGIPVIPDSCVVKDTISRIMLLDLDHVNISMGLPIQYYESDDMFQVGHLTKGVWYGAGELFADAFKVHAKARDLK